MAKSSTATRPLKVLSSSFTARSSRARLFGVPCRRVTSSSLAKAAGSLVAGSGRPMLSRKVRRSNWAMDRPPLSCGALSRSRRFSSPRARSWLAETFRPFHEATLAARSTSNWPWAAKVTVLPPVGSPEVSPDRRMSSKL
ncbi:hypothetical protein D3C71_1699060 [compost metagenome]